MQRDFRIDSFRGLLIILVVLGHVVGMAEHFCVDTARESMEFIFKMIYVFHMPAFFWLSGLTWRRKEGDNFFAFIKRKFQRLIVPYLLWGVLSGAIYYAFAGEFYQSIEDCRSNRYNDAVVAVVGDLALSLIHAGGWPDIGIFRANSVLWFLPALFTAEITYWVVDRYVRISSWQLIVAGCIFICGYYVPAHLPWGISRAMTLLPFLVLSRNIKARYPNVALSALPGHRVVLMLAALFYIVLCYFSPNHWIVHKSLLWYVLFGLLACFGIYISYQISLRWFGYRWVQRVGMSALGIMLFHKFVVVCFQTKISIVRHLCGAGVMETIVAVIVITAIAIISSMCFERVINRVCPALIGDRRRDKKTEGGGNAR